MATRDSPFWKWGNSSHFCDVIMESDCRKVMHDGMGRVSPPGGQGKASEGLGAPPGGWLGHYSLV